MGESNSLTHLCWESEPPACLAETLYSETCYQIQPFSLEWNKTPSEILTSYHLLTDTNEARSFGFKQIVNIDKRTKNNF